MEAEKELKLLYEVIGLNYEYHKGKNTMLTNLKNMNRRSSCLSFIENYLTREEVCDETGEKYDSELLRWGESPEEYLERFKKIVPTWNKDLD